VEAKREILTEEAAIVPMGTQGLVLEAYGPQAYVEFKLIRNGYEYACACVTADDIVVADNEERRRVYNS
jgi:hypothetical protein